MPKKSPIVVSGSNRRCWQRSNTGRSLPRVRYAIRSLRASRRIYNGKIANGSCTPIRKYLRANLRTNRRDAASDFRPTRLPIQFGQQPSSSWDPVRCWQPLSSNAWPTSFPNSVRPSQLKALDAWIDRQEASLTRPDAIRASTQGIILAENVSAACQV